MTISANFPNVQPSLLLDFANAKQLPPSVNFTRATTATYYDGSTTAKAEQNLALYSQEANSWTKQNASVTANSTTAPDGTSTADTVIFDTTSGEHYLYPDALNASTISTYTFSFYAKNIDQNFVQIAIGNNAALYVNFDISTGAVGTTSNAISSSITSVGSGWYRCVATFTTVSANGFLVVAGITSSTSARIPVYSQASSKSFYIWGAQVEQRSAVTAYTATSTQQITNYIPVLLTAGGGQPRFDHNPTTSESLGLLIEEQRTNLLLNSAAFGSWTTTNGNPTISSNVIVAPDGTVSGDKFIPGTANGYQLVFQVAASSGTYTFSAYAKAGEYNHLMLWTDSPTTFGTSVFNLTNGTIVQTGTGHTNLIITSVGNGWYRCSITAVTTSASPTFYIGIAPNGNTGGTFAGDGFSGGFLWGAQLEAASFLTSYIPTTSAAATRAADFASMTGGNFSSWFNNGQGTLFAEQYITSVVSGSPNNQVAASLYRDSNNFIATGQGVGDGGGSGQRSSAWVQDNNSSQFFQFTGNFITVGLTLKNAVAYEANNFAYSANTQTLITDSAGTVPSVNTLGIGHYIVGSYYYANNPIRKIAFYPVRVTNAQLQALTS